MPVKTSAVICQTVIHMDHSTTVSEVFQRVTAAVISLPIVSPQSASIVGPGIEPLTVRAMRGTPSGVSVEFTSSNQYSRTTPVSGASSYQLVESEKSPQQLGAVAESNSQESDCLELISKRSPWGAAEASDEQVMDIKPDRRARERMLKECG